LEFGLGGTTLALDPLTLALVSLEAAGERWFGAPSRGEPLWRLHAADAAGRRADLDGSHAAAVSAEQREDGLRLAWTGVADPKTGAGPFDVTVTVRGLEPGVTGWRIEVANQTDGWTLWSVAFPRLGGLAPSDSPERDALFHSEGWGTQAVGWDNLPDVVRRYPRGWDCPLQLLGYTRAGTVFSLATHDPALTTKEFRFDKTGQTASFAVVDYPEGMTAAGNGYSQGFWTVVAIEPGDWYDAGRRYGGWARRQAWAASPPVPRAADSVQVWQVLDVPGKPAADWVEQLAEVQRRLGVPLGAHLYNWHETAFDANYPDYFPARDGVSDLIAGLKAAGVKTMPYINGRLWDINAPSWKERQALQHSARLAAERVAPPTLFPSLEDYGSGQKLAPMCPATRFWQDTVIALCRRIVGELGADGVYLDQIGAEKAELCCDPAHGHPLGGGGFWLAGYRELLARLRAALPGAYLTTECNWEGCVADYDGLLTWHSFGDKLIPLYLSVYAGLAKTFGCQFEAGDLASGAFAARMADLFCWGAQLGWGDLTLLLESRHAPLLDYLGRLARTRAQWQAVFGHGRMLRPPNVTAPGGGPGVRASLWQAEGAAVATLFAVNPGPAPVRAEVSLAGAAFLAGPGTPAGGRRREIELEGLEVLALPVMPGPADRGGRTA
jgi:hypothetical protein